MISSRSTLESEADFDQSNVSSSSSSSSLSCHSQDVKNKVAAEQRNRVKKLRSIKLGRLPSLRITTRKGKIQSSTQTRVEFPDASPNYMKNTTSSDAKKESLQKSARSSFKPAKSLTRLSSTKYRRSLMRKSSGGSDIKKKTKKLRSIRPGKKSSIVLLDNKDASSLSIDFFDAENTHFQASSHNSESGLSSNDENKSSLITNLASGYRSTRAIKRTSSLRTPRILTKIASFRTKRPFVKKSSRILESNIQKATCSSALKDSKMADNLEVQPSGSESERISTMKVCPYSYCSLHGHTHSNVPPLKRFLSMRRRVLRKQKSIKLDSPSFRRAKRSNNTKRGIQRSETASSRDAAVLQTAQKSRAVASIQKLGGPRADFNAEGSKFRDDEDIIHSESVADMLMGDSEQNASDASTSPSLNEDSFDTSRNQILNTSAESKAIDRMGSASAGELLEEQVAAREDMEKDSYADSELDGKTEAEQTGMKKQKNMGLWNLIFQHMATSTAEGGETQPPLDKMKKEEQGDDENTLSGMKITDSSRAEQNNDVEDHGLGSPNIRIYQRNAIKLVQEAFDKILSEIPDHSSDDRSIIKDATSGKELGKENHSGSRELKFSTSIDSGEYRTVQDQQEIDFTAEERKEKGEEKADSKLGSISDPQTPKNWSNLKKILILRRFVKALEKVKGMKLRKPQYLPVQPDPEVEKIRLRRQSMGEKKNSEEWMLDYALQHVISTLAPAQKRKVSLLVQAFETIVPLPEIGTSTRSDIATSTHATPIQTSTASSFERGTEKGFQMFGVSLRKTANPDMISREDKYHVCDDSSTEEKEIIPESISDYKDPCSESGCVDAEISDMASDTTAAVFEQKFGAPNVNDADHSSIVSNRQPNSTNNTSLDLAENGLRDQSSLKSAECASSSHDAVLVNLEVQEKELATNYEINGSGEKSDELKCRIPTRLQGSIDISNVVPQVPVTDVVDESSKATEVKTMLQQKFLQTLALHEKSKSNSAGIAPEKMKNTKLWYMIYKHMVSGSETDFDEAREKTELSDDADALNQKHDAFSHQELPVKSQDIDMENHNTDNQTVEMQQIEAIRMVEEAIDEISLPDSQDDSPDSQSVTKHIISDQKHFKRQPDEGRDFSISNFIGCTRRSNGEFDEKEVEQISQDTKEACLNLDKEETKPKLSSQKSWSNLKKVILLKRFVKAMEKVKKFNPREPRFLPSDPADEQEKVNLRHQEMRDRKNADEWMLDYALQQVVAKLTPARKRKVELLVEAFETVVPTIGS